jgi:hypothetical protein
MKFTYSHAVLACASFTLFANTAFATFPSFDDLTAGDSYYVGDNFTSDSIFVKLIDFQDGKGNWYPFGTATISDGLSANGSVYELITNNISGHYDFAGTVGTQTDVEFLFGEFGGNINFAVNGDFINTNNFIDLDGMVLGGCNISVPFGGFGNDQGKVEITGSIDTLLIGGQELAVDVQNQECEPTFEDLTLNMQYFVGDSFTTDLIPCTVITHLYSDGTPATGGYVMVEDLNAACGDGQELFTNNAAVIFKFAAVSPIHNFSYYFGEYGGNINMAINGDFRNFPNYSMIDGMVIGGVTVHITSGGFGNDCGTIEFDGVINEFSISGQEHAIDCFEFDWLQLDDCEPSYEDLTPGDIYVVGDLFLTDDYTYKTSWFTWMDGTDWYGGDVTVDNTGQACSIGNELRYNNATTKISRTDGDWMTDVEFKFGEYGGEINLEINGDFVMFYDMLDIDGIVLGGVTVNIDYGGTGGDCGQVHFTGDMEYMRVGGQEFWIDCFLANSTPAPSIPGDVDGDGDVDLADLLALIGAWGTDDAAADVNGDGVVDTTDLLILISNWGS